jgi:hypothetical protein
VAPAPEAPFVENGEKSPGGLDTYNHAIPAMEETAASLVAALVLGD